MADDDKAKTEEAEKKAEESLLKAKADAESVKEVSEIIRALNPTIASLLRTLSRTVAPFFVMTIVFFVSLFETGIPRLVEVGDFNYGGSGDNTGVTVFEVRSIFQVSLLLAIQYMFIRFGYLYYQGLNLIMELQEFIISKVPTSYKKSNLKDILIQVCKENYMLQAFIIMRKDDKFTGLTGGVGYKLLSTFLSGIMVLMFTFFIGFSQFLSITFLAVMYYPAAVFMVAVYCVFYAMFVFGAIMEKSLTFLGKNSIFSRTRYRGFFIVIFFAAVVFNIVIIGSIFFEAKPSVAEVSQGVIQLDYLPKVYEVFRLSFWDRYFSDM